MSVSFERATKTQAFLRLALEGPAGYGKTFTALRLADALTKPSETRVAFVDTEAGSAAKYADEFDFDVIEMGPPFHPDRAVEAIRAAEEAGYGVIVIDSLSHFWSGDGGTLTIVDELAKAKYCGDSHRAWKEGGEIQQRLTDAILRSRLHVIAAMRVKKEYVREEVDGKTKIRAAGAKTVQRDEFDYEFDVIGRFDQATKLAIVKSRCRTLPPETLIDKPGAELADLLAAWLAGAPDPNMELERRLLALKPEIGETVAEHRRAATQAGHKVWLERCLDAALAKDRAVSPGSGRDGGLASAALPTSSAGEPERLEPAAVESRGTASTTAPVSARNDEAPSPADTTPEGDGAVTPVAAHDPSPAASGEPGGSPATSGGTLFQAPPPRENEPSDGRDTWREQITAPQKRHLNTLIGKLRPEHVTNEQLYLQVGRHPEVGADGELHFAPLRDSLDKGEASDLIAWLKDIEKKAQAAA